MKPLTFKEHLKIIGIGFTEIGIFLGIISSLAMLLVGSLLLMLTTKNTLWLLCYLYLVIPVAWVIGIDTVRKKGTNHTGGR